MESYVHTVILDAGDGIRFGGRATAVGFGGLRGVLEVHHGLQQRPHAMMSDSKSFLILQQILVDNVHYHLLQGNHCIHQFRSFLILFFNTVTDFDHRTMTSHGPYPLDLERLRHYHMHYNPNTR